MDTISASQNGYTLTITLPPLGLADEYTIYLMIRWRLMEEMENLCNLSAESAEYINKLQILSQLLQENKALFRDKLPDLIWENP